MYPALSWVDTFCLTWSVPGSVRGELFLTDECEVPISHCELVPLLPRGLDENTVTPP